MTPPPHTHKRTRTRPPSATSENARVRFKTTHTHTLTLGVKSPPCDLCGRRGRGRVRTATNKERDFLQRDRITERLRTRDCESTKDLEVGLVGKIPPESHNPPFVSFLIKTSQFYFMTSSTPHLEKTPAFRHSDFKSTKTCQGPFLHYYYY